MDSTKTWVDFGFHVYDSFKDYLVPVVVAALAGWIIPQPKSLLRSLRNRGPKA
jgi:hypothetical protein